MVPTYDRSSSDDLRVVDRWPDGVGWLAHPDENGRRTSHAVRTEDGVWVFDPLDAPGVDDLLAEFGTVAGVAVLSEYHARDAAAIARRHGVPVTVPDWFTRLEVRIETSVERVTGSVAGFGLRRVRPMFAWRECLAYREHDGTLYVPDYLSSHDAFTVGEERLGLPTLSRLSPPRDTLEGINPERLIFGHGTGVFDDADDALETALGGARHRFPRALVSNFPGELRAMLGALR
jgi:hypothetical protein